VDLYGDPAAVLTRVAAACNDLQHHTSDEEKPQGALYHRALPSGKAITLYPLIMGTVRIVIGDQDAGDYDDAWCYSVPAAGLLAAGCWDGEGDPPEGWFRHIRTARRRPEGDPEREYVAE
jgi:hypothetical protein